MDPPGQGTSTTRRSDEEPPIVTGVLRRRNTPPEGVAQFDGFGDPTGRRLVGPAAPSEGKRGTTFSFRVSPDPASDVRTIALDLFVLEQIEGRFAVTYATSLGVVSTNETSGPFQLRTVADDPPGTYCVAARFPDSTCSEFRVT